MATAISTKDHVSDSIIEMIKLIKRQYHVIYQQKIGSILYPAIISRPDIAKSCELLAEHMTKPYPNHMNAANHLIAFLYGTRFYAIQYGQGLNIVNSLNSLPIFYMASDAAYADSIERKSSEGFICCLFSGPIDWSARKQKTITLSTTEAELLALTSASKHFLWWKRLFKAIGFNPDQKLYIHCDNRQTIDLLTKPNAVYKTKLKHVDISNHWLKQEITKGSIELQWVSTNHMTANGLTKRLSKQEHVKFLEQLNMVNIENLY